MADFSRVQQSSAADTCEVPGHEGPPSGSAESSPDLAPDARGGLDSQPGAPAHPAPLTNPAPSSAGKPLRLRPASRHGRHARGTDARPGRRPSLSIRSAEARNWSADLSGPGPAGLVIHGLGGIGKSTLAAQIATRVSRVRAGQVVTTLNGEVAVASFMPAPAETDFVILDNFDDNLSQEAGGWIVRDPALAALLTHWPGKLLITCRRPFTLIPATAAVLAAAAAPATAASAFAASALTAPVRLGPLPPGSAAATLAELAGVPQQRQAAAVPAPPRPRGPQPIRDRLVFRQLGPLTHSGAWELTASLPSLRLLLDSERDHLWRLVAGHPLAIEHMDSLLALGARYTEVASRIEGVIQAKQGRPLPETAPTEWPEATATLIASAAGEQLVGELFERLGAGARSVLVRTSAFRLPVSPDAAGARPGQIAEAQAAGLLAVGPGAELSVHRWTASALHRCLAEAGLDAALIAAHRHAAGYWRAMAVTAPAGHGAELEAAYHDRHTSGAGPAEGALRRDFGPGAGRRRRRVIRIGAAGAVAALAAVLAVEATQGFGIPHLAAADKPAAASLAAPVSQATAVRAQAAAWVARQVSDGAIMACDPAMCSVLARLGISAGRLLVLGPAASDPLGSDVVLATAAVRGMFGNRLTSVYAPDVLASFGSGQTRIDVRAVAPDGAAAYLAAVSADLQARRVAGRQLLRDPRITFSAAARAQVAAGQVDARLLITLDTLAASEPVQIGAFFDDGPGASPGLPLRAAELMATPGPAGNMLAFFRAQRPPYLPVLAAVTAGRHGTSVLTVRFAAPAPLGLLQRSS